ncbi:MAG: hypothetical protein PVG07_14085 [Acidobacteriota bacterium]
MTRRTAPVRWLLPCLSGAFLLIVCACRPDPHELALRMIEPGEPVELSGGRTLTVERREGATLVGVRVEGPAEACDGTMEVEAREARLERASAATAGATPGEAPARLVLDGAVMVERCGELESVTRVERLAVALDAL